MNAFESAVSSKLSAAKPFSARGFTLIEMMISVTIFLLISSVVLANYNGFNARILLTNLAYDIALTIRQAQVYGVSARESSGAGSARPYGLYIERLGDGTATSFVLFTDNDNNGLYLNTSACSSECVSLNTIKRGNKISKFCLTISPSTEVCSNDAGGNHLNYLSLLFKRPNPDAIIGGSRQNSGVLSVSSNLRAKIVVISPQNVTKDITVEFTGQISVI